MDRVMCKIYVNHYGWVAGQKADRSLVFVKSKDGAKPFELMPNRDTEKVLRYIEGVMKCHRDVVTCVVPRFA